MAKVFTGKVAIPGDKLDEYFQALKEAEEGREPFRQYLASLNKEFGSYLSKKFTKRTVSKHTGIVEMFIEFLCRYTDVKSIDDITRGIANSGLVITSATLVYAAFLCPRGLAGRAT